MQNRFAPTDAKKQEAQLGFELASRLYTAQLIGCEPSLVLHGGGNCSYKHNKTNLFGVSQTSLFVKASGFDMANLGPDGLVGLWMEGLESLSQLDCLDDNTMAGELKRHCHDVSGPAPSIETLVHAWIPATYVDHRHSDAFLALASHSKGLELIEKEFGPRVKVIKYTQAGFQLAKKIKEVFLDPPNKMEGIFLEQHGLFTWGDTAQKSYERLISLVTLAETKLMTGASKLKPAQTSTTEAITNYLAAAPQIRKLLKEKSGEAYLIKPVITEASLQALETGNYFDLLNSPPLTPDHLIRTKPWPLVLKTTPNAALPEILQALEQGLGEYKLRYQKYFEQSKNLLEDDQKMVDPLPRQLLIPGIGALALAQDATNLEVNHDILVQSLTTKIKIKDSGHVFKGLADPDLFKMEYRPLQKAKLKSQTKPLSGKVALVCGAAGASGSGITHELLESGALVVISDLAGKKLDDFSKSFKDQFPGQVLSLGIDITDMDSISSGINEILMMWGAIDLVVLNAGLAHVSTLAEMDLEKFQLLEKVNIEGTLLLLKAFSIFFQTQGTSGDIVLVSTKNVPSPSASFGAYSATKAAGHQLARIASLELAPFDVRVNMVSPDGVFSDAGKAKSGLWALVGPDRMKARGLDEKGLEEYYQNRNLLKTQVTARHVGKAVLYFATRQSPTTGVSLPVDGGLADATPR